MTSLRRPTARILPLATATASARMALSFIVRMGPPDQMLSAACWADTGAATTMHSANAATQTGARPCSRSIIVFPLGLLSWSVSGEAYADCAVIIGTLLTLRSFGNIR